MHFAADRSLYSPGDSGCNSGMDRKGIRRTVAYPEMTGSKDLSEGKLHHDIARAPPSEGRGSASHPAKFLTFLLCLLLVLSPVLTGHFTFANRDRIAFHSESFQTGISEPARISVQNDTAPNSSDLSFNNDTYPAPALRMLDANFSSALAMFLYVRNTIFYDPYYGSMKGAYQTFSTQAGDDADQASLLITLLRLSGIPSRYVFGVINLSAGQVENWLGFAPVANASVPLEMEMAQQASYVLSEAGIPYHYLQSSSGIGSEWFIISHIWVEAYLNGRWILMDPSFKQYYYFKPIDWQNLIPFNDSNLLSLNSSNMYGLETYANSKFANYLVEHPNMSQGNVYGGSRIVNASNFTMPYTYVVNYTSASLPKSLDWLVSVTFPSYNETTGAFNFSVNYSSELPTTILGNAPLAISSVPNATTQSYIRMFPNGIFSSSINVTNISMSPTLTFNGRVLMFGSDIPLGVVMPVQLNTIFNNTVQQYSLDSTTHISIGGYGVLAISLGHDWSPQDYIFQHAVSNYSAESANYTSGQEVQLDQLLGEKLFAMGRSYFIMSDAYSRASANYLNLVEVSTISIALVAFAVNYLINESSGGPYIAYGGDYMDEEVSGDFGGIQLLGNLSYVKAFDLVSGEMGSYLEGVAVGVSIASSPISTSSLLFYAMQHGIPIAFITPENYTSAFSELHLPTWAEDEMLQYLDQGFWIIAPSTVVNTTSVQITVSNSTVGLQPASTWSGVGFVVLDPNSYDAGYYIAGSISIAGAIQESHPIRGGACGASSPLDPFFDETISGANQMQCVQEPAPECVQLDVSSPNRDVSALIHVSGINYMQNLQIENEVNQVSGSANNPSGTLYQYSFSPYLSMQLDFGLSAATGSHTKISASWSFTFMFGGQGSIFGSDPEPSGSPQSLLFNAQASSTPGPSLLVSVGNGMGAGSGYMRQQLPIYYSQYYSGYDSQPQLLMLFELPPGVVNLTVSNNGNLTEKAYGEVQWSTVQNSSSASFGNLTVGAYSAKTASLDIKYSGNISQLSLGKFLPASSISMNSSYRTVSGDTLVMSGTLENRGIGAPISGQNVSFYYRQASNISGAWHFVRTLHTNSSGVFSLGWEPPYASVFEVRAVYSGNSTVHGTSSLAVVSVEAYLNLTVASKQGGRLSNLTVTLVDPGGFNTTRKTDALGTASFLLDAGSYLIGLPANYFISNLTRFSFLEWPDSPAGPEQSVDLIRTSSLSAIYLEQYEVEFSYKVNGSSPLVSLPYVTYSDMLHTSNFTMTLSAESLWVDAGSNLTLHAAPDALHSFVGWSIDGRILSNSTEFSYSLAGPAIIMAVFGSPANPVIHPFLILALFAILLLLIVALVRSGVRKARRRHRNR